jgi:Bacterial membrane protein YfhO
VAAGTLFADQYENIYDPAASTQLQDPMLVKGAHLAASGQAPTWSANVGLGAPLLANMQSGVGNPLNWPFMAHPTMAALDALYLGRLLLAGLLMSLFVAYLGVRPWIAGVAGVLYMLSGQLVTHVNNLETLTEAMLPLLLLGAEMSFRAPGRAAVAVTAAATALAILGGMPEQLVICVIIAVAYALTRLVGTARSSGRGAAMGRAGVLAGGAAIGVGLALPVLLPFLDYVATGWNIHPPGSHASSTLFDWHKLAQIVAPRWAPLQSNQWFGVAAFVVALLGLRSRVLPWGVGVVLGILGLVLTLKVYGVPAWLNTTIDNLPVIERVNTERFAAVGSSVAVALLVAGGLQRLRDRMPPLHPLEVAAALLLVAGALAAHAGLDASAVQVQPHHVRVIVATVALFVAVAGLLTLSAVMARRRPRLSRVAAGILGGAAAIEVMLNALPIAPLPLRHPLYPATPMTATLARLAASGHDRVMFPAPTFYPDIQEAYGFDSPQIIDALFPSREFRYLSTFVQPFVGDRVVWEGADGIRVFDNPFIDAIGVSYIASRLPPTDSKGPPPPGQLVPLGTGADAVAVYRNTRAMARANVFYDVVGAASEDAAVSAMRAGGFDPRRSAVVESSSLPASPGGTAPAPSPVTISSYADTHVTLDVQAARAGVLVLSDAYAPGWTAEIDGRPVDIVPANLALRGVVLSAGHHVVTMDYSAPGLKPGIAGAIVSALVLAAVAALPSLRRRLTRAASS